MKRIFRNSILCAAAFSTALFGSCSLDEYDPTGFTFDAVASNSIEGYEGLLNNSYFGLQRHFYGTGDNAEWMCLTEGDTDLWTYRANQSNSFTQWFWFFAGAAPNLTYTNGHWNSGYDGIGACNTAIMYAPKAPFKTDQERNKRVAEAHFLRAVYYFNIVEQWGAVPAPTEVGEISYSPVRTEPMDIYRDIIIPDLEFAAEWLDKGTDATMSVPTKKSALGFLAKACLQTKEYGTDEFLQKGMEAAKKLIADCEAGGATYGAYMYPTFEAVFDEANNMTNKEALWKHSFYAGKDNYGSSNGNWKLNRNDLAFLCQLSKFGAREDNKETRLTWEGSAEGFFMPTQHLLSLYVQSDNTLDPRFHASFMTEWKANRAYTWTADAAAPTMFDKDASVVGQSLEIGDLAIKIVMPQDEGYAEAVANKKKVKYLLIDYKDLYDDAKHNVKMQYNGAENQFRYIYPSLSKHNSSNYYVASSNIKRNGNLNATFIMRMSEIYLIAAELDIYLNGGANAMGYINKVRQRAGAKALSGTATVRTVLDERGRELCGEYCRFYDLKRTGMFKDASYLQETHPDLARYFKPEYALRPIPTNYTDVIANGDSFQNPGY